MEALLKLNPEHLSCYGLKLEQGTPLYERREQEQMADDDTQADMYLWMVERLKNAGYGQYEISNFARPGRQSRHNLKYWMGEEYIGFGPSAHSYFGQQRYSFVRDLDAYVKGVLYNGKILDESTRINRREMGKEYLMLRMRTIWGGFTSISVRWRSVSGSMRATGGRSALRDDGTSHPPDFYSPIL